MNTVALERAIVEAKNSYRDPRDRERDRFDRDRGRDGPSYGSGGNSSNDGDRQDINSSSSGNDRRDAGELEEGEEREEEGEMRASAAASAAGNSNRDRYNDGAVETVTDRAADDEDNDDGDGLLISSEQDEEERRLAESRARRAAILARKAAENSVSAPTANAAAVISVAVSTNSSSSSSSSALLSSAAPLAASASMAASNGPISASGSSGSKAAAPAPSAASAAKPAITSVGQQKPSQRGSAALLSMFAEDAGDSDYEEEAAVRRPVGGSSGALLAASASSSSIFASTAAEDAAGFAAAGSAVAGRNAAALINADGDGSGEDASGAAGHHGAAVAAAAAAAKRKQPSASSAAAAAASTLSDNWDDAEGYYRTVIGELLDGRYQLLGLRGRGVFSSVVYCRDTKASEAASAAAAEAEGDVDATVAAAAEGTITTAAAPTAIGSAGGIVKQHAALAVGSSTYVAVKIVRSNDTMRRAGLKELDILRQLMTADPTGRYHCVRLLATFEHRNHLCLVFEPLALNLKEVQNKFGKGVGISLVAVRAYAKQLLLSLALLAKLRLIHADIKPHNVLANERYNVIKVSIEGRGSLLMRCACLFVLLLWRCIDGRRRPGASRCGSSYLVLHGQFFIVPLFCCSWRTLAPPSARTTPTTSPRPTWCHASTGRQASPLLPAICYRHCGPLPVVAALYRHGSESSPSLPIFSCALPPFLVLSSHHHIDAEIILGYKHSPALDMWSLACCLYELNTGAPLFPGEDNNDMLWRFQVSPPRTHAVSDVYDPHPV